MNSFCHVCSKTNASIVGNCYVCGFSTCASCVDSENYSGDPKCIKCSGV